MATFHVLAKRDLDADAALAPAVGCPPSPTSLAPLRRPVSAQRVVLREGPALPRLSGRGSQPANTLVAALVAERNSANLGGELLRFVRSAGRRWLESS